MPNQVFKFDLDKSSDLEFKVIIDGVSSESINSILFRFIITDPDTKLGLIIPAKKETGSDMVEVTIPENPPGIVKEKLYSGVLEAVVGNIVLKPAEIELEFQKSVVVEAVEVKTPESEVKDDEYVAPSSDSVKQPFAQPKKEEPRVDFSAFEAAIRSSGHATKTIQETKKIATKPVASIKNVTNDVAKVAKTVAPTTNIPVPVKSQAQKEEPYIVLEFVQEAKPKAKQTAKPVPLELAKLDTLMESLFD